MFVRRERPEDVAAVRAVVRAAFGRPDRPDREPVEVGLLDALRTDDGWLPALSLVAVDPNDRDPADVTGHVLCTRASVDGIPVLGLGPLAVRPDRQRAGVGTALMHAVLGAAEALDEPLVGLVGEPAYYGRFGFRASSAYGIVAPEPAWGRAFQIRPLSVGPVPTGAFEYAMPFRNMQGP